MMRNTNNLGFGVALAFAKRFHQSQLYTPVIKVFINVMFSA
ncbi:hypothetical protein QWZ08_07355 [Ferruginibacter paludis]|nr:hypothetical protein [Ferruginibacter paludis]MDN3655435.1 hypothetical protein [Ferruginibacter paludis]